MKSYKDLIKEPQLAMLLEPVPVFLRLPRLCILLLLLIVLLLIFVRWTPAIRGEGQIIAFDPSNRRQIIESPIEGRVSEWLVTEGVEVKAGQLIARMVDIDPNRLERMNQQLQSLQQKFEVLEQQERRSSRHVERMKILFAKGIESKRGLELAEIDLFKVIAEIKKVKIEISELESNVARQTNQEVFAPVQGTIMKIIVPENSVVVKVGEQIAKIVPQDVLLAAEVIVSGKDLPLISVKQTGRIVFEGWPSVQVVGWPSVAVGTFPGVIKFIDPGDDGKGNFRVVLLPSTSQSWPKNIRMGTRLRAWIQLKKVPLWWEIWRLLSGVPPKI